MTATAPVPPAWPGPMAPPCAIPVPAAGGPILRAPQPGDPAATTALPCTPPFRRPA